MLFSERLVLDDGRLIEIRLPPGGGYLLCCRRGGQWLLAYRSDGRAHWRRAGGHEQVYPFKSVEQLRYDFERDVEDA